ncbi:MAG: hypothetical protein IJ461_07320 [Clostridia bacterium]|nr:hypothetical protein [Clostridia bacterium]
MQGLETIYPVGTMQVLIEGKHPSEFLPGQWTQKGGTMVKTLKDKTLLPGLFDKYSDADFEVVSAVIWQRTA